MYWSKYNVLFEGNNKKQVLYNSLSNSLIELDKKTAGIINKIKTKLKEGIDINLENSLIKNLLELEFITKDKNQENKINLLKLQKQITICDRTNLSLTIMPTSHCNFNCSYCFEENRLPIYMDDNTEEKIIQFIKKDNIVKNLFIDWYGGEPLLGFDRITSISNKLNKLKINYNASITTNGYLLNEEIIPKLGGLNIRHIQITIDGDRSTHNERRPLIDGNGTFDIIIKNIETFYKFYAENQIKIVARVNIDNSNKHHYFNTYKFLKNKFKKIRIYPGIVKDISSCQVSGCTIDRLELAQFMIDEYEKNKGFRILPFFPSGMLEKGCIAERYFDYIIGPMGELYKCWNDVGISEMEVGNIHHPDKSNIDLLTKYLIGVDPFDDKKCRNCFYFPTCGGGCPSIRLKNKYYGGNGDPCDLFKGSLTKLLQIHHEIKS